MGILMAVYTLVDSSTSKDFVLINYADSYFSKNYILKNRQLSLHCEPYSLPHASETEWNVCWASEVIINGVINKRGELIDVF